MTKSTDLFEQLEKVLRKFSTEDMRDYALRELPVSWASVCKLVKSAREDPSPRTAASAISRLVRRSGLQTSVLQPAVENLKLMAVGLSKSKLWRVYKLKGDAPSLEDSRLACCVGRALTMAVRVIRVQPGAQILGMGVGTRVRVAMLYQECNLLLVGWSGPMLLDGIIAGLGYTGWQDANLSGQHPESLIRMMQARRGGGLRGSPPPAGPQHTAYGLKFHGPSVNMPASPPRLNSLELRAPRATLIIESGNVLSSLKEMVTCGLLADDSPLLHVALDKARTCANLRPKD